MNSRDVLPPFLMRIARFRLDGPRRTWVFFGAGIAFVVGFLVALSSVELDWAGIGWFALGAAIVFGVPLMTLANAAEYKVSGIILGKTIGNAAAIRIAVLSTAANLLPLPGGPLVKIKGLVDEGERPPRAVAVTVIMGGAWLSMSVLIAGLFGNADPEVALPLTALGLLLGAAVLTILVTRVVRTRRAAVAGMIGGVELAATLATGLRMWLVAVALGFDVGSGALVLGVAPVLGAAVVLVPAGLGVRELIASLAAPAVGLDPAAGFLIASVDRLGGMFVHGAAALAIALSGRHPEKAGVVE